MKPIDYYWRTKPPVIPGGRATVKSCIVCSAPFETHNRAAKYCSDCKAARARPMPVRIRTGSLDPSRAGAACQLCQWAFYGTVSEVLVSAKSHLEIEHRTLEVTCAP